MGIRNKNMKNVELRIFLRKKKLQSPASEF